MTKAGSTINISSNRLRIGLILLAVLVMLIMIGFYFGIHWASQDLLRSESAPDRLTADLEEKRMQIEAWGIRRMKGVSNG